MLEIHFEKSRWKEIEKNYERWWKGEIDRPLIQVTLEGCPTDVPKPELPYYSFTSFYDLSIPAEKIVDVWTYELSKKRYLGDAFPHIWPNFGPGVIAAFLGADLENGVETTWFHPKEEKEISQIDFEFDEENIWFKRVKEIVRIACERWEGNVQIGLTDLGGNLDILSTFRPAEGLLLDLYDYPEEVERLTWKAHELWWKYFEEFAHIARPYNPGYTAWTPIFSKGPYYILQCDFCYMIGPEMFDRFVKPELEASCKRLANAFYHLDGVGQLPHLDSLLEIKELKGIQWVPGDGKPSVENWPDVYRKIRNAGKLIQFWGNFNTFDRVVEQLGSAKGIVFMTSVPFEREKEAIEFLKKYEVI